MQDASFLKLKEMVHELEIIDSQNVPFRDYVVESCAMNYCGRYGKTWQCPPGVGSLDELKQKCLTYKKAVVFTTVHSIEDSFDIEGMDAGRVVHESITDNVILLFDTQNIRVLSAEGCNLCETCTYPTAPCRFPDKARSSVEANGISVVEPAKDCGINDKNGNNTVTYFSMIFYND